MAFYRSVEGGRMHVNRKLIAWLVAAGLFVAAVAAGYFSHSWWLPWIQSRLSDSQQRAKAGDDGHGKGGHNDEHAGHDDANSLELSEQARKTLGVELAKVQLTTFEKALTIPGLLVERPGRSQLQIAAPMTGIVTRIYPIRGEAVEPGQPLFEMRLTHEELVQGQADFLRTAEELDVMQREVERLTKVVRDGAVAGKSLLERQYDQQRQMAIQRAQRQSLLLHGLSEQQIEDILKTRKLLYLVTVQAPQKRKVMSEPSGTAFFQVQELRVQQGQHVTAGDPLAVLVDHATLYVEGHAFERDIPALQQALANGGVVSAVLEVEGKAPQMLKGLKIHFLDSRLDADSRELNFYVTLPNFVVRDATDEDGKRFVAWRFRPGQRLQLRVPVEQWEQRIVLPAEAVAQEGLENFVFQPNGDHFDRQPVQVEYRDQFSVVIANDGSLHPGDFVAIRGAQQMQLALKNKAGGGIDPHAGHSH